MLVQEELISIIIVNFNSGNYLLACLTSLLSQHRNDLEIIVSDNGSTDQSIKLLKENFKNDPRLQIIENNANLGYSKGNNVALKKARGEYILFLNPDCIVMPNTLNHVRQVMKNNSSAGMVGCLVRNTDGSIQESCVRNIPTPWNSLVRVLHLYKLFPHLAFFEGLNIAKQDVPQKLIDVPGISGAFMFVRRTAIEQVGMLDENYFLYCEDTDWMFRFQQEGWKILFTPEAEVTHAKGICGKKYPLKILWYKHKGMTHFYRKFFRQKYPWIMAYIVYLAIWARFTVLYSLQLIRYPFKRV